jgi:hypothetical protein
MLDNKQGRSMSVYSCRLNGVHHGLNRKFGVRPHCRQQRRCSLSHKLLYQAVSKVTAFPERTDHGYPRVSVIKFGYISGLSEGMSGTTSDPANPIEHCGHNTRKLLRSVQQADEVPVKCGGPQFAYRSCKIRHTIGCAWHPLATVHTTPVMASRSRQQLIYRRPTE